MKKVYLNNEDWKLLNERVGTVKATVPGCVHTDLAMNDKIPDMFWRDNNESLKWIENENWTYSCSFEAKAGKAVSLVFEGLDTYADVYLNGSLIGKSDNMFIEHEFDISSVLKDGENTLEVFFRSPIAEVKDMPQHEAAFTNERVNTRRVQCTYGWDWVERYITCGIYRPVYIKYADDMYISDVYISTDNIDRFSAQLYCEVELKNYENGGMVYIDILSPEGKKVAGTEFYAREELFVRRFDIVDPELWYPLGYGEQPLYTIKVRTGENEVSHKFGIRTVKILQIEDEVGSKYYNMAEQIQQGPMGQIYDRNEKFAGFRLIVNGKQIFCKGANWVPCEPFPSAENIEKFDRLIYMAKEMNLNFLRIWGGGIFEHDHFYDACDEAGIIVVQDFLMACGEYPEKDEWFLKALALEAEYAVKKLRNHPCLAWWHGDNENARLGSDIQEDYLGRDSALRGNGPVIYRYDRMRQFLPSSPFGGNTYASITRGTSHTTNFCTEMFDFFHETDGSDFKEFFEQFKSRFIAEEPIMGMASRYTLLKCMTEADILEDESEEMFRYHTKNNPEFHRTIFQGARELTESFLGEFKNGEDKFFKYKYLQYEWVRVVFENIRRNIGYCDGMVFWMFDDCWPASMGWSMIDYNCQPKSGFYSFKRCARSVLSSVTVEDGKYAHYISNDGTTEKSFTGKAYLLDMQNGFAVCDEYEFSGMAGEYAYARTELPWQYDEKYLVICESKCDGIEDRCFYKKGNMHMSPCNELVSVINKTEDSITVKASGYVHAVELESEYLFEDNFFTLMAGEERTIHFERACENPSEIRINAYTF